MAFFLYFCNIKMEQIIQQTVEVLRHGGTILYPTDTIWGIGCDARNKEAVERIYAIKKRGHSKSMLILCTNEILVNIQALLTYNERPTTYILHKKMWQTALHTAIADNLPASDGSLGIRVPNHSFCQELIRRLGAPIVSTSANFSGYPSPSNYAEIAEEIMKCVDYCVPPMTEFLSNETQGSRIVKIGTDGTQTVIRP